MHYGLIAIREHTLFATKPEGLEEERDITFNWSFQIEYDFLPDEQLEIRITTTLNILGPTSHPGVAQFSVSHFFHVPELDALKVKLDQSSNIEDNQIKGFMATLFGISLGTIRGIAFTRTVNVLGGNYFMPVVNPTDLFVHTWNRKMQESLEE